MSDQYDRISFRLLTAADIGVIPIGHQGDPDEVLPRIADQGSSAMLAFVGKSNGLFHRLTACVNPMGIWHAISGEPYRLLKHSTGPAKILVGTSSTS